jgi:serine protease Do
MNRIGSTIIGLLLFSGIACFAQPTPPQPPRRTGPVKLYIEGSSSFLGVGVAEVDTERAKELKLKEERGVEVKNVEDDSPASKAGVKVGDVVLDFNGQRVEGQEQFVRLVRETPVGRQVKLLISRNGSTQTLTATIGSRSPGALFSREFGNFEKELGDFEKEMKNLGSKMPDLPRPNMAMQSRALGVESESLSAQLAEYFGVKEGALVRSVNRGSAAEKAGIKAGDVITKIGDRKVGGPSEISGALRSITGKSVSVTITRNQKEMTVTVTLDERSSGERRRSVVRMTL